MDNKKLSKTGQNYLSVDLITDIISRVSVKDLWRFTCVSKSWCSLIRTDPYLSRLLTASLDRPCLIIEEYIRPGSGNWLSYNYWIDLDSIEDQSINIREIHSPFDRHPESPRRDPRVLASCRDLLLLRIYHSPNNKYVVSNPITGKHVVVPPNPAGDDNVVVLGFGYDRVQECYKLLTRVKHRDQSLELMVYDLEKGTWKRLQFGMWWKSQFQDSRSDFLYFDWDKCDAKCVGGGVYWCFDMNIPGKTVMRKMVCFLLAEEKFHVVKPPDLGEATDYYTNSMTIFDGKLGLLYQGLNTRYEFWSINLDYDDDGKREWRWTKLLTISDDRTYLNDIPTLVCFSACRNKILIFWEIKKQFLWYDLAKKDLKKLNNPINGSCQDGRLFWYDMVEKEIQSLHNHIDGQRYFKIYII